MTARDVAAGVTDGGAPAPSANTPFLLGQVPGQVGSTREARAPQQEGSWARVGDNRASDLGCPESQWKDGASLSSLLQGHPRGLTWTERS